MNDPVQLAREFYQEQGAALGELSALADDRLRRAVEMILAARDPVVVTGIGKSGLIARKIAATLASTGTPAMFMHPVEGVHGDLGAVGSNAVLIALSKSGQTEEIVRFVGHFKRLGGRVVAVSERGDSALAESADIFLPIPARPEAGPLGLAPTTSTLLMLTLGDAISMALLDARGFDETQFARFHPDGSLGRRLLTRASDLMHAGKELPSVRADASFQALLVEITSKRLGMTCVVKQDGSLIGVFTDGDLRRLFLRGRPPEAMNAEDAWRNSRRDPGETPVRQSMVSPGMLAVDCLRLMRESEISVLILSEDGERPTGVVRLQDIVRAGIG